MHPIDIVEAPIWDVEGLATILSGEILRRDEPAHAAEESRRDESEDI